MYKVCYLMKITGECSYDTLTRNFDNMKKRDKLMAEMLPVFTERMNRNWDPGWGEKPMMFIHPMTADLIEKNYNHMPLDKVQVFGTFTAVFPVLSDKGPETAGAEAEKVLDLVMDASGFDLAVDIDFGKSLEDEPFWLAFSGENMADYKGEQE